MTAVDEAREAHAALADALMALRDKDPDALRLLLDTGSRDYAYAIAQRLVSASGVRAEREGLVAALEAFRVAFEETGVHEHEREDDGSIDLCIPIAPLKPVYWAACAALGHRWMVVDVEPFCERCGFREGDDDTAVTADAALATPPAPEPKR
jgi:hypothetical protein